MHANKARSKSVPLQTIPYEKIVFPASRLISAKISWKWSQPAFFPQTKQHWETTKCIRLKQLLASNWRNFIWKMMSYSLTLSIWRSRLTTFFLVLFHLIKLIASQDECEIFSYICPELKQIDNNEFYFFFIFWKFLRLCCLAVWAHIFFGCFLKAMLGRAMFVMKTS